MASNGNDDRNWNPTETGQPPGKELLLNIETVCAISMLDHNTSWQMPKAGLPMPLSVSCIDIVNANQGLKH